MLTCQQLTELVTEYLDGRMSLWRRAQFQMHLGMCRHCRTYLDQIRETVRTLGKLPEEQIPPDVKAELLRRFRDMQPPIYRELVHARFRGALEVTIPRTLARLGAVRVEVDLEAFVALRASRSPYLRDVAREFVEFAAERWRGDPGVPRYLSDLVRHELLPFEIAAAENDPPCAFGDLSVDACLRFQSAARLVHYRHAVHLLPEKVEDRSKPEERECWLLAYRDAGGRPRFLELSGLAAALVARLMRNEPLGVASSASCTDVGLAVNDAALADIAVLLDDLERRGALLGTK